MASSLAKVCVSDLLRLRSVVLFRPVITSASCFFNTKRLDDKDDCEDNVPTFIRTCSPFILSQCPDHSTIQNLPHQLNLMDDRMGVKREHKGYTRWHSGEDTECIYISRSMTELHEEVKECVPPRDMASLLHLTHFDTPCPGRDVIKEAKELDQFVESTSGMHVISSVRVFCTMRYIRAIYIIVGHEGPDPENPYGGYIRKIYLPRRFYKIEEVKVQTFEELLKITIPKKNNEKQTHLLEGNYIFFREKKTQ